MRSYELRLLYRTADRADDEACDAVNKALHDNEHWLYAEEDATSTEFEDARVAWFRVFGNLGAARNR